MAQIYPTLADANSGKVTHLDLNPSNIMVGAFGEVQVMDWGVQNGWRPTPIAT